MTVFNTLRKCPHCGNHLTSDRDVCALSFCTPPAKNSAAPGASGGADRQGVCASSNFTQSAIDLINLAAERHERDACSPRLRPVLPASDESFNAEIGQSRIAVLSMCLSHIAEHGDGALSSFLGDCLQQVPECEAYTDRLCDLDTAISRGEVPEGSKWGLARSLDQGRDMSGEANRPAEFLFRVIEGRHDSSSFKNIHSD